MKSIMTTTVAVLAIAAFLTAAPTFALEFHVSPSGSDKNPGTKAKPFQTIAHARDSVAKINNKMTGDIVVYLGGGTYSDAPIPAAWDDKDSAAKNHDVGYNLIHRTMGLHDDGGGIYTLGKIPGMHRHQQHAGSRLEMASRGREDHEGGRATCSVSAPGKAKGCNLEFNK